MSVDVEALDDDHKKLFALIGELAADEKPHRRKHLRILAELEDYAENHFRREEAVMTACGYPRIERHRQQHDSFCRILAERGKQLITDPETDWSITDDTFLPFLKNWLSYHILVEDKAYGPYVEAKRHEVMDAIAKAG